ncbi:hypothetical protein [Paenibacillus sp. MSJ-34]|uniref:hypothetical protein n=1 Tax=Paenibacillus sp. MSJ-34 TaxID=2841529 RepID=UPI001C123D88|nr:hypothetical protein [Paenibacillus sp. MSJ-34]MBU5441131.1 hypothetical protein [Paenibacillus sp. MSJ-34]
MNKRRSPTLGKSCRSYDLSSFGKSVNAYLNRYIDLRRPVLDMNIADLLRRYNIG